MIKIAPDVQAALDQGRAVVALESTVLAHGLPSPQNLEVGRKLERVVAESGALAATIGVLDGAITVGIGEAGVERMARGGRAMKLSTREIAIATSRGIDGATTVASTAFVGHRAGIRVMATGGIGGVHRGDLPDVSADLTELQRTPILCVCSGAKSILDLPATREALETGSVLVLGWQTDEFPAFYSVSSGLGVDARVETATEVAAIVRDRAALGDPGATLLCVPPPTELALPRTEIDSAIEEALAAAERGGIRGKDITPFLLRKLVETTGGRSLEVNVALLQNNARVAGTVAVELAER